MTWQLLHGDARHISTLLITSPPSDADVVEVLRPLSRDYLRLAEWRCGHDTRLRNKVLDRTGIPNPDPPKIDGQLDLFAACKPEWGS